MNQLTRLENLPDEILLYEIFPLFSWSKLYHTFAGLNQRFDNILKSTKNLSFTVNTSTLDNPALYFFAPCIARLIVCLAKFNIIQYSTLRSLTLQYPSMEQRNAIRPKNFPYLEYLNLSYPLTDSILLNLIFSNAFEHLKECKFDTIHTDHSWNGSPKLRSLSISVCGSYGVVCILRACPNITRLNIIVHEPAQSDLSLPRHSISCRNLFLLRHLFIRSSFEILTPILTLMPNLKWLTFDDILRRSSGVDSGFNSTLLANNLLSLRQLSYLHFTISTSTWDRHKSLHTLHPLFRYVKSGSNGFDVIVSSSVI